MKSNLISFLFGVIVILSLAANHKKIESMFTFKPATPTSVLAKTFGYHASYTDSQYAAQEFIKKGVRKGFILKTLVSSEGYTTVVMEKY